MEEEASAALVDELENNDGISNEWEPKHSVEEVLSGIGKEGICDEPTDFDVETAAITCMTTDVDISRCQPDPVSRDGAKTPTYQEHKVERPAELCGLPSYKTLHGSITLEQALEEEDNMVVRLAYWQKHYDFKVYLLEHKDDLESLVSRHLGLSGFGQCHLELGMSIHGSFNYCIPVYVGDRQWRGAKCLLLRFPLPYRVGEEKVPGNADQKLRCEAATYIWIEENCIDVPTPQLLGFAFSNGRCVSQTSILGLDQRYLILNSSQR